MHGIQDIAVLLSKFYVEKKINVDILGLQDISLYYKSDSKYKSVILLAIIDSFEEPKHLKKTLKNKIKDYFNVNFFKGISVYTILICNKSKLLNLSKIKPDLVYRFHPVFINKICIVNFITKDCVIKNSPFLGMQIQNFEWNVITGSIVRKLKNCM